MPKIEPHAIRVFKTQAEADALAEYFRCTLTLCCCGNCYGCEAEDCDELATAFDSRCAMHGGRTKPKEDPRT